LAQNGLEPVSHGDQLYNNHPKYHRVVVKAGTSVLTSNTDRLDMDVLESLARQVAQLRQQGVEVLLVTSGAIAAGRQVIGRTSEHRDIPFRQVLAAVGQGSLLNTYEELFAHHGVTVAQALLTWNDLSDRQRYLNIRGTLTTLMGLGVVPILNENDVVAVDEIGENFGDNDHLSALVANLVDAELLITLTDTDGLYTADPKTHPEAELIPVVEQVDAAIQAMAGEHSNPWARGGMPTKIDAARLVTTSGIPMVICNGRTENAVLRTFNGEGLGTLFQAATERLEARKRWMLSRLQDSQWGEIVVDAGAVRALRQQSVSLLPAGVRGVKGDFQRGDIVYINGEAGESVACGIANYRSSDIARIRGLRSDRIQSTLGYHYGQEVVHRNNLVLL
jgi:glutamate 5-kinase